MSTSSTPSHLNRRMVIWLGSSSLAAMAATPATRPVRATEAAVLEGNKSIIRRIFSEPLYTENAEAIRALYAKDFLDRTAWIQRTETMLGLSGASLTIVAFREAHPELTVTLDHIIAEADLVAAVATWGGVYPPAGIHVVGKSMHVFRLASGQIVEQWSAGWEGIDLPNSAPAPYPTNPLLGP